MNWMIYGANGYTGALITRMAIERGLRPVLAGRRAEPVEALSRQFGSLETRAFTLDDPANIAKSLERIGLVLHCAGPFAHTFEAMSDACLAAKAHYLDITGEVAVFEALSRKHQAALSAGVMLLPGAGFDVVPSDCLAAHLKRRLPTATRLTLGFQGLGRLSHGTATTMVENIAAGSMVRENGRLIRIPAGSRVRDIDFGIGPARAAAIPWGDLSTAYHSTGIPNIEVFAAFPPAMLRGMQWTRQLGWLLGSKPVQAMLKWQVRRQPAGPSDAERARGASLLWGEARDEAGRLVASRLRGPEGYTLTALTACAIVQKVLGGVAPIGFQTPSLAFGPDFILEIPGVSREDLA